MSRGKSRKKARNNLDDFDTDRISADLDAVEMESLRIDPHAIRNAEHSSNKQQKTDRTSTKPRETPTSKESPNFKPRSINVVDFSPQRSELLHAAVRRSSAPEDSSSEVLDRMNKKADEPKTSQRLKVKNDSSSKERAQKSAKKKQERLKSPGVSAPAPKATGPKKLDQQHDAIRASIDGFGLARRSTISKKNLGLRDGIHKRAEQIARELDSPDGVAQVGAVGIESLAVNSMHKAGQFNSVANRQMKTSLHAQQEKYAAFNNSLEGSLAKGSSPVDTGLANGRKLFYNTRSNAQTMGGVDQHGLTKGRLRRVLSYRSVRFLAPIVGIFIVGVYIFYLNLPNINLKIAENRSGLAISQPSYAPEGFSLDGPVRAETGQIEISFKNGEKSYDVSQKKIDWDSSALLENKVLRESAEYNAYTDRGLTIYVYDGKAVWVNQGKVNQIDTKGSPLDTEELIRIAGSM